MYYKTIEDIKATSDTLKTKSCYEYYLLNKYEILDCGDVQKHIKKRQTPEEPPVYYVALKIHST